MKTMELRIPGTDTNLHHKNHVDVDPRLLDVLVCPLTRGALHYDRAAGIDQSASAESLSDPRWCANYVG